MINFIKENFILLDAEVLALESLAFFGDVVGGGLDALSMMIIEYYDRHSAEISIETYVKMVDERRELERNA